MSDSVVISMDRPKIFGVWLTCLKQQGQRALWLADQIRSPAAHFRLRLAPPRAAVIWILKVCPPLVAVPAALLVRW
jgi:hypothetical protein